MAICHLGPRPAVGNSKQPSACLSVSLCEVYAPAYTLGGRPAWLREQFESQTLLRSRFVILGTRQGGRAIPGGSFSCSKEQLTEQFVVSTLAARRRHLPTDGLGIVCQAGPLECLLSASRLPAASICRA